MELTDDVAQVILIVDTFDVHLPIRWFIIITVAIAGKNMAPGMEKGLTSNSVMITIIIEEISITRTP